MKYLNRKTCVRWMAGMLLMAGAVYAAGSTSPVNKDEHGVAIKGYDVIGYFDEKRPVKGSPEFKKEYQGVTYLFASAAHRDRFSADPESYLPQYGGYCAYGMAKGHKAPIDPEAWSVIGGRLYLNYNTDVRKDFSKDTTRYIEDANKNWPKLK
jgi:YHS domain-containing protein